MNRKSHKAVQDLVSAIEPYIQKRPAAYSKDGVLYFYWGHYELKTQVITDKANRNLRMRSKFSP